MAKTLTNQITDCIEYVFDIGGEELAKKIIIFPCGDIGIQIMNILKSVYSIEPAYLIDNHKCKYNSSIKASTFLEEINTNDYVLILATTNYDIYMSLRETVLQYFKESRLVELEEMKRVLTEAPHTLVRTTIGRYNYGSICRNHEFIKSIGSFCSFADGVEYVANHPVEYITTHPFIFSGQDRDGYTIPYESFKDKKWYLSNVSPRTEKIKKLKRATIGNDVWLGKNVTITNYANIGNGVIAAAGAVITKDVPDYAVVAGVPAKIIRYRYTPEQIEALNEIAWWDWTDDEIRERYDDFYLPIEDFIKKYR